MRRPSLETARSEGAREDFPQAIVLAAARLSIRSLGRPAEVMFHAVRRLSEGTGGQDPQSLLTELFSLSRDKARHFLREALCLYGHDEAVAEMCVSLGFLSAEARVKCREEWKRRLRSCDQAHYTGLQRILLELGFLNRPRLETLLRCPFRLREPALQGDEPHQVGHLLAMAVE